MSIPRGRLAIVLVILWVLGSALATTAGPYARLDAVRGQVKVPEETPGLSPAGVTAFLSALGPEGRRLYGQAQWLDFVPALLFGGAGLGVLAWACTRLRLPASARWALAALPVLVVVAEVLENSLLLATIRAYPSSTPLAGGVGGVTTLKFGAFVLTVASALVTSIWAAVRARRAAT